MKEGVGKMRYNKGEWSEAYVFLKILGDGHSETNNEEIYNDNTTDSRQEKR